MMPFLVKPSQRGCKGRLLLLPEVDKTADPEVRKYGLTGLLPGGKSGVVGLETGRPGLVLALEGNDDNGRRPGLHFELMPTVSGGLVRREFCPFVFPLTRLDAWLSPLACVDTDDEDDTMSRSRHFFTKLFARFAKVLSEVFFRSSFMCLPNRLT